KKYRDPNTVRACYAYDGLYPAFGDGMQNPVGHLTSSWSVQNDATIVAADESYQFDPMGRLKAARQCTPATCPSNYPTLSTYDALGNEASYWDSSTARYSTYTGAAWLSSMTAGFNVPSGTSGPGSQSLINISAHTPFGALANAALGNGLAEARNYNPREWLSSLTVGSVYSLGVGYAGNGNVTGANDSNNGNWTYQYDGVNRLTSASATGQGFT